MSGHKAGDRFRIVAPDGFVATALYDGEHRLQFVDESGLACSVPHSWCVKVEPPPPEIGVGDIVRFEDESWDRVVCGVTSDGRIRLESGIVRRSSIRLVRKASYTDVEGAQ